MIRESRYRQSINAINVSYILSLFGAESVLYSSIHEHGPNIGAKWGKLIVDKTRGQSWSC